MKKFLLLCSFLLIFLFVSILFPKSSLAVVDPLSSPNNKFGVHILDPNDIPDAQALVNSSGGDWGYVTMVIRSDERNLTHWQEAFNRLRRAHLIPIIRLATKQQDNGWEKFTQEDIDNWIYFLNSLNWVVENRYVIIGNEPNHATEWGGEVNPTEYTNILCDFSQKLKASSEDFFVLPAGLDASAPNKKGYMSEEAFITQMYSTKNFTECVDGWTSHSYPNPDFSATEYNQGKGSVKTYIWEREYLKSLGITKNLPVFITETGWVHGEGNTEDISNKFVNTFTKVWTEDNIVAITPFVLNYQEPLFKNFSWKNSEGGFYPFYFAVQALPKTKGKPVQLNEGEVVFTIIPNFASEEAQVKGMVLIKNKGQAIWNNDTKIIINTSDGTLTQNSVAVEIEPTKSHWQSITFKLPLSEGSIRGRVYLQQGNTKVSRDYNFEVLTFKQDSSLTDYLIQIKNYISGWITQKL